MMTHIFIIHSTTDDDFVTKLALSLREKGLNTYVDHENILAGEDWDSAIENAVQLAIAIIYVISPEAVNSANVKAEWNFCLDLVKPMYPVLLQPSKIPYRLRLKQRVDFTGNYDKALGTLLKSLQIHFQPQNEQ
ncbi:MAG: toll/interleukin-1 receptor domain-containing protein [Anaerolineae bacterium]|nr:toll/interleukin-1 receptor domain-containing protein [Anaerolineae bacterium]